MSDPLAGYTSDWRKKSDTALADPLADYSPDWKAQGPGRSVTPEVGQALFGAAPLEEARRAGALGEYQSNAAATSLPTIAEVRSARKARGESTRLEERGVEPTPPGATARDILGFDVPGGVIAPAPPSTAGGRTVGLTPTVQPENAPVPSAGEVAAASSVLRENPVVRGLRDLGTDVLATAEQGGVPGLVSPSPETAQEIRDAAERQRQAEAFALPNPGLARRFTEAAVPFVAAMAGPEAAIPSVAEGTLGEGAASYLLPTAAKALRGAATWGAGGALLAAGEGGTPEQIGRAGVEMAKQGALWEGAPAAGGAAISALRDAGAKSAAQIALAQRLSAVGRGEVAPEPAGVAPTAPAAPDAGVRPSVAHPEAPSPVEPPTGAPEPPYVSKYAEPTPPAVTAPAAPAERLAPSYDADLALVRQEADPIKRAALARGLEAQITTDQVAGRITPQEWDAALQKLDEAAKQEVGGVATAAPVAGQATPEAAGTTGMDLAAATDAASRQASSQSKRLYVVPGDGAYTIVDQRPTTPNYRMVQPNGRVFDHTITPAPEPVVGSITPAEPTQPGAAAAGGERGTLHPGFLGSPTAAQAVGTALTTATGAAAGGWFGAKVSDDPETQRRNALVGAALGGIAGGFLFDLMKLEKTRPESIVDAVQQFAAPAAREGAGDAAMGFREAGSLEARSNGIARAALGRARNVLTWDGVSQWESGGVAAVKDATQRPYIEAIAKLGEQSRKDAQHFGKLTTDFYDRWFPHLWDGSQEAKDQLVSSLPRRPLQGPASSLKRRTIEGSILDAMQTIKDRGLDLKPRFDNPTDMFLAGQAEMNRWTAAQRIREFLDQRGLLQLHEYGKRGPDGFARVNDELFRAGSKGEYWAPEPVARIINNNLAPGMRGNTLYDAYMGLNHSLNRVQLGLSFFHGGFVTVDAVTSRVATGIQDIMAGRPIKGIGKLVTAPAAPLAYAYKGAKIGREWLMPGVETPEFAKIVDWMTKAGGRSQTDAFYRGEEVSKFLDSVRRDNLWAMPTAGAVAKTATRAATGAAVGAAAGALTGDTDANKVKRAMIGGAVGALALGVPHAALAALESVSGLVLEKYVPAMKRGAFAELAESELSRLPATAGEAEVRAALGRAWDSVDNRLGQVVYDNVFWNRSFKDLMHATQRSVGWNYGTVRELGGGLLDIAAGKGMTPRAAYVVALPVTVGMMGGTLNVLLTGELPRDLRDYFMPRTGRKDAEGNEERVNLPSYMKDVFAYAKHPLTTVTHKVSPVLQVGSGFVGGILSMLSGQNNSLNQNYYGDQIVNPDLPVVKQLGELANYLGQAALPFAVTQAAESKRREQPLGIQVAPFVGITPTPRWATRSKAENLMTEIQSQNRTPRTPSEAQAGQLRGDLLTRMREGKLSGDALKGYVRTGQITPGQAQILQRRAKVSPILDRFRGMPTIEDMRRVYAVATPEERRLFWPTLQAAEERRRAATTRYLEQ